MHTHNTNMFTLCISFPAVVAVVIYFPPVVIDGVNIKVVESAKLLGLTISNDLTWRPI